MDTMGQPHWKLEARAGRGRWTVLGWPLGGNVLGTELGWKDGLVLGQSLGEELGVTGRGRRTRAGLATQRRSRTELEL
jgi:hypothetical protein